MPPPGDRPAQRYATSKYPITYETAYRALGSAENIVAVNHILAIVAAMEAHARASNDRSLELDAIELRFHAECRLDDMVTDHASPRRIDADTIECWSFALGYQLRLPVAARPPLTGTLVQIVEHCHRYRHTDLTIRFSAAQFKRL